MLPIYISYFAGDSERDTKRVVKNALGFILGFTLVLSLIHILLFDAATGQELARAEAGSDAKSIALSSESAAYVLGVSEIRRLQVQ